MRVVCKPMSSCEVQLLTEGKYEKFIPIYRGSGVPLLRGIVSDQCTPLTVKTNAHSNKILRSPAAAGSE